MTLDEYFATGPPHERPIFDALMTRLIAEGLDIFIEPVSVGIFLKRARTFAELRPMQRWVALGFSLRRKISHRTIIRKPVAYGGRYWIVANLHSPDDLDDDVVSWVIEAYEDTPA